MNQEKQLSKIKILIIVGFTLTAFTFTLGIITYVIPNWVKYRSTGSSSTQQNKIWSDYNRNKGLFQECLNPTIPKNLVNISTPYSILYNCTDNDIGQYGPVIEFNYSIIIKIRQSQIGIHGAALLCLLIVLFLGVGIFIKWCCSFSDSPYYIKWRTTLGIFSFLAFLCLASSSSLGTSLILLEKSKLFMVEELIYWGKDGIIIDYDYMFYLAWTATFLSLLASILFFVSSQIGKTLELEKYKPHVVSIDNPGFNSREFKMVEPIFLQPTSSSLSFTPISITANEINSPGLLPRYDISTFR